jgi:hypothetical protein
MTIRDDVRIKTSMKIRLLVSTTAIGFFALSPFVASAVQLSPPTLQPSIIVSPAPQVSEPAKAAAATTQTTRVLSQWHGQYEGDSDYYTQMIRTQETWSRLWSRIGRPSPQVLDETREMAIFISVGERPTGGFIPRVITTLVRDGKLVVVFTDGKPSEESFVTQAITRPWVVAIVGKSSLPVVVQKQDTK